MVNSTLTNFAGFNLAGEVRLPSQGSIGTIWRNDKSGPYGYVIKHGIWPGIPGKNANFSAGTEVGTEQPIVQGDIGSQWEIGMNDSSGYFTIKNPHSGRFLTAFTADKLTIEGM